MNDTELCARILVSWQLTTMNTNTAMNLNDDYNSQSFTARVLRKKIEVFKIPIKVPDYLIMLIEMCTGGNPGVSQLMLKEIMSRVPNLQPDYEITPMDFSLTYPSSFPIMSENPKWEEHFSKMWDAQKDENGQNKCDTRDWWMEVFKS